MKQDFFRGGGIVGKGAVGAEFTLETTHIAGMGLHVYLCVCVCMYECISVCTCNKLCQVLIY